MGYIQSHTQFEDDTMANIQPVNVMVEDVTKTAVEFPCTSDDAGGCALTYYLLAECPLRGHSARTM